jgi:exopolyphosphatase/guanosine-5'-triphosphate,3'-diphosphate pyrophosphatase
MRLGVLDIGSNTGHLLVVDAHRGAAPLPAYSHKETLRLAEHLEGGEVTAGGIKALTTFVADAVLVAEDRGAQDMLGFATSAVRDARNCDAVLDHVADETGVRIAVLPGDDEARLTFLAVRRWFGWSAGRLSVFDIGGGSLEIAGGPDEEPDVAWSIPLGAARLARDHFSDGTPDDARIRALRKKIRADIAQDAGHLLRAGPPDVAAATSKTFGRWPASAERRRARWDRSSPGPSVSPTCRAGSRVWSAWNPRSSPPCPGSRRAAPTRSCPAPSSPRR